MLGVGAAGPMGASAGEDRGTAAPGTASSGALRSRASADLSERDAWAVVTSVSGVGPVGFAALLRRFGSARAVLAAARRPGAVREIVAGARNEDRETLDASVAETLAGVARDPAEILAQIAAAGVEIVTLDDPGYPARLRAIEIPPPVLYVSGSIKAMSSRHAVAVVGTRRATERGRLIAARIGAAIARAGGTVVSGLAVGIDGAAQAAVTQEPDGVTVAVLGSGHGRLYPRAHAGLACKIVSRGGAVVSELPPAIGPSRDTFPRRNRLISGLADATVVVEAGAQSGALITAGWALEQGRDCFMVPGPIDAPRSAGCLGWLREFSGQVRIVAGIPELIEDLGLLDSPGTAVVRARPSLEAELIELGSTARTIAMALVGGRGTLDELVATTGHPVATALGALTLLELRGLATSTYGRYRPAGRLASADPVRPPAA